MFEKMNKWTVCYIEGDMQTFDKFDTKEELLGFVDKRMNDGALMTDFIVYPPVGNLTLGEVLMHGVPDRFKIQEVLV
ncbi:hypothetical protein ABE178_16270 [Priestia megaterium]